MDEEDSNLEPNIEEQPLRGGGASSVVFPSGRHRDLVDVLAG
jgi:hypothetical protein